MSAQNGPRRVNSAVGQRPVVCAITLLAIILGGLIAPRSAEAHARFLSSDPPSGSALATMPATITIRLTEPIDIGFASAHLETPSGTLVPTAVPALDPTDDHNIVIAVTDPNSQPNGTYVLVWRVVSAADGHATAGTVAFSVGTGISPGVASTESTTRPPWWRLAVRWVELAGLIVLTGGFIFGLVVGRPVDAGVPAVLRRWWFVWAIAGVVFGTGLLLSLIDQGLLASGRSLPHLPPLAVYRDVLLDSSVGTSWIARLVIGFALVGLAYEATRPDCPAWIWWLGVADGAAALATLSFAGHASAEQRRWTAIGVDWAHSLAIAAWLGGLAFLIATLGAARTDATLVPTGAAVARRFSWLALPSVVVLVVSGFISASFQVGGTRSLQETDYGRSLILKHLLLLPMLVIATVNLLVMSPRIHTAVGNHAAARGPIGTVRRFAAIELALGAVAVFAAAALTELPPADGGLPVDVATRVIQANQTASAGDLSIAFSGTLQGKPTDQLDIDVRDATGQPVADVQRLIVQTSTTSDGEPLGDRFDADPVAGSPGRFSFPATRLGLAGPWTIDTIVRRAGLEDARATFALDTTAAVASPPRLVRDHWRFPHWPIQAVALAALAVAVAVGGLILLKKLPGLEPLAALIVMVMTVLIAGGFLVQAWRNTVPVSASTDLANPAANDPGAVQRGDALYQTYCLACHGVTGRGPDVEDDLHRHGSGVDLLDRRTKAQTDGDLFSAITNGVPGSTMPAFDLALTEAERWDLVARIRDLQQHPVTPAPTATP